MEENKNLQTSPVQAEQPEKSAFDFQRIVSYGEANGLGCVTGIYP